MKPKRREEPSGLRTSLTSVRVPPGPSEASKYLRRRSCVRYAGRFLTIRRDIACRRRRRASQMWEAEGGGRCVQRSKKSARLYRQFKLRPNVEMGAYPAHFACSRSLRVGKPGLLCLNFATSLPSATVGRHHSREGMSSTTLDKQERNPRGIPRAPFIVRILLSSEGG